MLNKKTKKKIWTGVGIVAAVILGIVMCRLIQSRQTNFTGSRVKNPDAYQMDFTYMNAEDSHTLSLKQGDTLHVEANHEQGKLEVVIGIAGATPIYKSDDIETGSFDLSITEAGDYVISIHAKKAKGSLHFALKQ